MLKIKMMLNRKDGYILVAYAKTVEEAKDYIRGCQLYYGTDIIDIYYTIA